MNWQTPLKPTLSETNMSQVNAIHDSSKFITVTCRLKPLFSNQEKSKIEIDTKSHAIILNDPTKSISKTYSFDQIFDQTVEQDHFTNTVCQPLVGFLKNGGQSGLIFSYGITNSGKTYTILGTKQNPGILLTLIKKLQEEFKEQTLRIVACQLYKDEFFSLKTKGDKLHPKELRGTFTFDQCHSDVINENNMEELFSQYLTNRSCSSTSYNTISSRSHAIFKITCKKFRIGVVDLAGSQRTTKGNDNGIDIKETIFINSSLLTLKKCIKSLEQKSQLSQKICIPYRESKLTQSLVEYFVPNSKINIIVNINQARHCLEQNLNVMDYTSKTKNITANVMSDFSQMLKSTARKKEEMIVAVKSYKVAKSNNKKNIFGLESNKGTNSKPGKNIFGNLPSSSKPNKFLQSQNKDNNPSQQSNHTQQLFQAYKQLESIMEQNDQQHKKSQHAPTTVCQTQLATSNILIEQIEYHEFNPQKKQNQHKLRYSVQFVGEEHKYIIEEEMIENQQLQQSLIMEIQKQERKSFIQMKNNEQTFEQFVQKSPISIEDFIMKQQQFKNYLAFDRQFQAQEDARKLSALKKVNLFETTKKKQSQPEEKLVIIQRKNSHQVQLMDIAIGTDDMIFNKKRTTEQLNQTIENMDFEKLRTNVKRKLLDILKDDEKKRLVNEVQKQSENKNHSFKKGLSKSLNKSGNYDKKFNILEIDEISVQNEESNFTTPSKNIRKQQNGNYHLSSQSLQKNYPSMNSQANQSILKKTFDKVASGVKSGVQFMADKVGLGNHIFKTNSKVVKNFSQEKNSKINPTKCEMKIWNEISQIIEPQNKMFFISQESQQVQVNSSIKKVRLNPDRMLQIQDDRVNYPQLLEKEIDVMVFEVATQTEEFQTKFVLEDIIEQVIHEEKNQEKKKKNFKKGKKQVKIQENSQTNHSKGQELKRQEMKRKQMMEKTAFKCNSVRKDIGHSLKKRPEVLSITKSIIAHKTRGAKRRHDHH